MILPLFIGIFVFSAFLALTGKINLASSVLPSNIGMANIPTATLAALLLLFLAIMKDNKLNVIKVGFLRSISLALLAIIWGTAQLLVAGIFPLFLQGLGGVNTFEDAGYVSKLLHAVGLTMSLMSLVISLMALFELLFTVNRFIAFYREEAMGKPIETGAAE